MTSTAKSQKFHLKSLSNNSMVDASLDQAIKKSSVKGFIKKGVNTMNDSTVVEPDENLGLEEHLMSLKKSCSDLTREIKLKEVETNKCKDETNYTCEKTKKAREERLKLQDKIAELEKNLEKVNCKREAAFHGSKTYEHILQRMKKDDIFYQLNKNELQRELRNLEKTYSLLQTKHYNVSELEKLSSSGLKDANLQLYEQKHGRNINLNSIQQETQMKIDKQNKLKQRQKQTEQIQELAADDIQDADLIKLKKFLTVQVFLRELLKGKITKLKQYYEPYERAFFQIKSSTNVRDANSLKFQFFNFESSYNQKTVWVKHLEGEIAEAEEQRKILKQRLMESKIAEMEMVQQLEGHQKTTSTINKKELNQRSLENELVWERIQLWLQIQAKKMKIPEGSSCPEALFSHIVREFKPTKPAGGQALSSTASDSQVKQLQ